MKASLVLNAKAKLGEGIVWHSQEQKLYWVDIEGRQLHIFNPASKETTSFSTGERIGALVPTLQGDVIVALQNGLHRMDTSTGEFTFLTNPLTDGIRFNDGKCDPSGRFWIGSMHLDVKDGAAALYRFDGDKKLTLVLDNLTISNGIAWSADKKTMYHTDTPKGTVSAFDYDDATGNISNKRILVKVPEEMGSPDGMTIDENDNLWTALWGGGAVACWNGKTGDLIQTVEVPARQVTCCTFGGDNLQTLYITTARESLSEQQLQEYPHSGGIFSVELPVKGVPLVAYAG
ncbi:SMP-30/gluconolactonase/LRE family protein [Foetidibacter luteolus]|uniref:SMP-30/gluconolactonase/LRE family protein n=1 Tax=Foetidibacter luteolus TaxID=2608880 RepID=UPI001A97D432|nr:SMP-30/gluconolactonase/LRE family protein [Foetidibacter luteolus]